MKHNELQIVTLKNRDPDILDHLFQIMCYYTSIDTIDTIDSIDNFTYQSNCYSKSIH